MFEIRDVWSGGAEVEVREGEEEDAAAATATATAMLTIAIGTRTLSELWIRRGSLGPIGWWLSFLSSLFALLNLVTLAGC